MPNTNVRAAETGLPAFLATTHLILCNAEDDVRSLPELLAAIERMGDHAHSSGRGLEPDECRALYRLAGHVRDIARRVETMWDQAFAASGVSS